MPPRWQMCELLSNQYFPVFFSDALFFFLNRLMGTKLPLRTSEALVSIQTRFIGDVTHPIADSRG
ncbi:hypothetical protein DZJ_41120 [Dickeya ananatis]